MAGGLVGLLDDVAALAKLAAASVDDVGAAAAKASAKAAGVVIDDTAVTPAYVRGLAAERELPIIRRIAIGSLRNKLLIILPAALLLSAIAPIVVEIILMFGGCFLAYEGAHKIIHALRHDDHDHDAPAAELGPDAEAKTIAGAIRTDFILSAEIMVIALKEVIGEPVVSRGVILAVVGVGITVVVYGVVALIVKMDDVGLALAGRDSRSSQRLGRMLVAGMPKVLAWLSVIGTAAMLWVGGGIIVHGLHHFHLDTIPHLVDLFSHWTGRVPGIGAITEWLGFAVGSAAVGFLIGSVILAVVHFIPRRGAKGHATPQPPDAT